MSADRENTREMQSSHAAWAVSAAFDEPNLVAEAGLVPVVRLAERTGLPRLVGEMLRIQGRGQHWWGEPGGEGDVAGSRDVCRGGQHRGHQPAASRSLDNQAR